MNRRHNFARFQVNVFFIFTNLAGGKNIGSCYIFIANISSSYFSFSPSGLLIGQAFLCVTEAVTLNLPSQSFGCKIL